MPFIIRNFQFRSHFERISCEFWMTPKWPRKFRPCSPQSEVLGFPDGPRLIESHLIPARNTYGREGSMSTTDTFNCGRKSAREVQIENKVYGALNYTFRSYFILKCKQLSSTKTKIIIFATVSSTNPLFTPHHCVVFFP